MGVQQWPRSTGTFSRIGPYPGRRHSRWSVCYARWQKRRSRLSASPDRTRSSSGHAPRMRAVYRRLADREGVTMQGIWLELKSGGARRPVSKKEVRDALAWGPDVTIVVEATSLHGGEFSGPVDGYQGSKPI